MRVRRRPEGELRGRRGRGHDGDTPPRVGGHPAGARTAARPHPRSMIGIADSAANLFDKLPVVGSGTADLTRVPSIVIDEGPQRRVHRYRGPREYKARHPVLLVPPLAAPASCFDLRRGCSVVEHLTTLGYPTYLVDYGAIGFSDRQLGLEHWVEDVIPNAVDAVRRDAGGDCVVQVVGCCLGGIMALLGVAERDLPVSWMTLI